MNLKRKPWLLLFVLICTLILAGCAGPKDLTAGKTAEQIIEESFDKWYELESYDMDMVTNMKMSMGQEVIDMSMTGKITTFQKPMKMKMVMDVTIPGMEQAMTMEQYMVEEEQKVIIYQHIEDTWQKMVLDDPAMVELMSMDPRDNLKLFMDNIVKAEILGEEKIGDRNTLKIVIVSSGKIFEQLFQETAGNTLGITDDIFDADLLSKIGDMNYLIWIDKATLETVKCYMDMSENMKNIGNILAEQENIPDSDELIEVFSNMEMSLEYSVLNQNKVQDFTIPEEAKNAKEFSLSDPQLP